MIIQNKRLIIILTAVLSILLIPLIEMQFTTEVNWSLFDFLIGGLFLFAFGVGLEVLIRMTNNIKYRFLIITVFILIFILIWADLAVGIFNLPWSGN